MAHTLLMKRVMSGGGPAAVARHQRPDDRSTFLTMGADMHRTFSRTRGALAGALLLSLALVPAVPASAAPTQVKPGFNVFSAEQDVEIGRQSAVEAERQLPLLNDRNTQSYVESVFSRLAAQAPAVPSQSTIEITAAPASTRCLRRRMEASYPMAKLRRNEFAPFAGRWIAAR